MGTYLNGWATKDLAAVARGLAVCTTAGPTCITKYKSRAAWCHACLAYTALHRIAKRLDTAEHYRQLARGYKMAVRQCLAGRRKIAKEKP